MTLSDDITCALKVLCSDSQEFQKRHKWVTENVEARDQCLVQDENIPRELHLSLLEDKSVSCTPQSTISANRICEKVEL